MPTGIGELDRVLGGGIVPGSVVLLAGEPGVGKSTLTLQLASGVEKAGRGVALICAEESLEQVADRARRLGGPQQAMASAVNDLPTVLAHIAEADLAIIDSIQTIKDPSLPGEAGAVGQVRACAAATARLARETGVAVILVGHVTKDGSIAGPRVLEHLVDTVVTFEGDREHQLRVVRTTKNRFGSTFELGIFEMSPKGLIEVPDASGLLLSQRLPEPRGSMTGCIMEGRRPLALEVQALVVSTKGPPRRIGSGIESARLALLAAILHKHCSTDLSSDDIYGSIAGGFRASEPGIDLALALAMFSSKQSKILPRATAAVGEVGLSGEVRSVPGISPRLSELSRLGFTKVIVPKSTQPFDGIELTRVEDLRSAISLAT